MPDRNDAVALLFEFTESESLRKHAFAVETAMRAYAAKFGEDAEEWGMTGLLHDFDYERHPTAAEHPFAGNSILGERGYPDHLRRAIMSHADHTGVSRDALMEKALFACDELCGFILAVSYVRPDKKIGGMEAKSVRKKMKDKAFARAVSRDDLLKGTEGLGVEFDTHVTFMIEALSALDR